MPYGSPNDPAAATSYLPPDLAEAMARPHQARPLEPRYEALKAVLLD